MTLNRRISRALTIVGGQGTPLAGSVTDTVSMTDVATGNTGGGGTGILWQMNITSGAAPNFGFSTFRSDNDGVKYNYSFVAGGGPNGRDAVQLAMIGQTDPSQIPAVWSGTSGVTGPPQGDSRFVRYYLYFSRVYNILIVGGSPVWGIKMVILTASPDSQRAIDTIAPHTGANTLQSYVEKNINGEPDRTTPYPFLSVGWNAVQWEIDTSTTTSSGDGIYKLWLNTDTYASPSGVSAGTTSMTASALGGMEIFFMDPIDSGQSLTMRLAALQYASAFDPNWYANMGT